MPAYSGKFECIDEKAGRRAQGACQLRIEEESSILTPASGPAIAFDLGDVDAVSCNEWDLELEVYPGLRLTLRQFGAAFGRMAGEFMTAWRNRTVQCLLLEDLEEVGRFSGSAALGGAAPVASEIRLYESNLAVLPVAGTPFQWRLADVDSISFDEDSYTVALASGAERLAIAKLGKKTDEFLEKTRLAFDTLRERSASSLRKLFPFLDAGRLERLLTVMPEGRSAPLASLASIHPRLVEALLSRAVDRSLKPYFDALRSRSGAASLLAGFKFVRAEEEEEEEQGEAPEQEAVSEEAPEAEPQVEQEEEDEEGRSLFFWFFFPVSKDVVAWEASTGSGRATYFFRIDPREPVEAAVGRLTRGLALVNFRREPVYLPDRSLEEQARYRKYAIGARKLADLRALRAAMMGRAVHTSLDRWSKQVQSIAGR